MTLYEQFRSCWFVATIGFILFIFGCGILFWNEGRAINTILSLDEALDDAITLTPYNEVERIYEGRIVHFYGPIMVGEPLTEPDYNIQILAVKLKRRVQMYQWYEESVDNNYGNNYVDSFGTINSDKTYYYTTIWSDKLIDSKYFHHESGHRNPNKFPTESQMQIADTVTIGKYELGFEIKNKFNNYIELTSDQRPEDLSIKLHLGFYYHCNDVFNPEIGDIRLLFSFTGMEGDYYTIVGKLQNGKIVPYRTTRDLDIILLYQGELSLEQVFKLEHHAQRLATWGFRFIGWVLLFLGSTFTASLLHTIMSRAYFMSALIPDALHPITTNIILSFSLALCVTAISWVFHRPWIGAGLLFAAASPFLYCARNMVPYQKIN